VDVKGVVVGVVVWVWIGVGAGCGMVGSGLGLWFVLCAGAMVSGLVVLVLWKWVSLIGFASATNKCGGP